MKTLFLDSAPQQGLSVSTSLSEWLSWEVVKGSRALPSMAVQTDHPVGLGAPLIALDRLKGKKERGEAGRLIGVSREGEVSQEGRRRRKEGMSA